MACPTPETPATIDTPTNIGAQSSATTTVPAAITAAAESTSGVPVALSAQPIPEIDKPCAE